MGWALYGDHDLSDAIDGCDIELVATEESCFFAGFNSGTTYHLQIVSGGSGGTNMKILIFSQTVPLDGLEVKDTFGTQTISGFTTSTDHHLTIDVPGNQGWFHYHRAGNRHAADRDVQQWYRLRQR